ncbi:hypothetical protein F5B20DRAFT_203424 [Whalleya microplaca]|nr:hypothetical protein F5B20DRAFT_203424 [Whalleya microplaca]
MMNERTRWVRGDCQWEGGEEDLSPLLACLVGRSNDVLDRISACVSSRGAALFACLCSDSPLSYMAPPRDRERERDSETFHNSKRGSSGLVFVCECLGIGNSCYFFPGIGIGIGLGFGASALAANLCFFVFFISTQAYVYVCVWVSGWVGNLIDHNLICIQWSFHWRIISPFYRLKFVFFFLLVRC